MNQLEHLPEFTEVLADYHASEQTRQTLEATPMMLFAGPTNSGRNTMIAELLKTDNYHYMISDTTRKPRMNNGVLEQDGVQYWFRSEEEMLANLRSGRMVEAAIIHEQQVSGISIAELEKAQEMGKIAITDIEVVGVQSIMDVKPDAMCLFVVPPSLDVWRERILGRGGLSEAELLRRLKTASKEFKTALSKPYYWFVVNDNLADAVAYCEQIARNKQPDPAKQAHGKQIAEQLLQATQEF